jgi:hypothetical protein
MTVTSFHITTITTGDRVGYAFVCPDLKYASILVKGQSGIARRLATPAAWADVAHELQVGIAPREPLPSTSAIVQLLVREHARANVAVQYAHSEDLPTPRRPVGPFETWLDHRLRQLTPWSAMLAS